MSEGASVAWKQVATGYTDLRGSIAFRKTWASTDWCYRLAPVKIPGRKQGYSTSRTRTAYDVVYYEGGFGVGKPAVIAEGKTLKRAKDLALAHAETKAQS
jgi:hypothetical protein